MTDEPSQRPVMVSREDLYKQVWAKPMSRLAADYGISGNGLAKICDRLNIPYPRAAIGPKKPLDTRSYNIGFRKRQRIPQVTSLFHQRRRLPRRRNSLKRTKTSSARHTNALPGAFVVPSARHYCRLDRRAEAPARRGPARSLELLDRSNSAQLIPRRPMREENSIEVWRREWDSNPRYGFP